MKVQKDGSLMWTEIEDLAALIRSGKVQEKNCLLRFLINLVRKPLSAQRSHCGSRAAQ
jgi:hypothetical protein